MHFFTLFFCLTLNIFLNEAYTWIPMDQSKTIPNNCGYGDNENFNTYNGRLYIARVKFDNDMVAGKFVESSKTGYFPHGGDEKLMKNVEILCGGEKLWETAALNRDRHLSAGTYSNGENSYICQSIDNKNKILGTFRESTGNCCYPLNGKQVCNPQYSLLVNDC